MKQELRIIITQACNYNCYFCHHEGLYKIKKNNVNKRRFKLFIRSGK